MGEKFFQNFSPQKSKKTHFFDSKIAKNDPKNQKKIENFFWSESIQNGPKRA